MPVSYNRYKKRLALDGYIFIAPLIIGFLIFTVYPLLDSIRLSFTDWTLLKPPNYIGFQNYEKMFTGDKTYVISLINTIYYVVGSVPLRIVAAFFLALALNQKIRGITLYRIAFYIPVVSSWVAVALVWQYLYSPEYGLFNYLLRQIGITGPDWLVSRTWAMPAVIIVNVWKNVGYNMIILLAGLQGIPVQLYEAARIDGAKPWKQTLYITIPLLTPTIFFILIMSIISSFQVFSSVYIMTAGGPGTATYVYIFYLWQRAFVRLGMGYASAMAWILFAIIFIGTLIQWRVHKKWVYYG